MQLTSSIAEEGMKSNGEYPMLEPKNSILPESVCGMTGDLTRTQQKKTGGGLTFLTDISTRGPQYTILKGLG